MFLCKFQEIKFQQVYLKKFNIQNEKSHFDMYYGENQ